MKLNTIAATFIIIIFLSICVWGTYQFPHLMLSPGRLLEGHTKTNHECLACHTFFKGTPVEKCTSCHKLPEIGLFTTSGTPIEVTNPKKVLFHQGLTIISCSNCHTDHVGDKAGGTIQKFDHSMVKDSIIHDCVSCHQKPEDRLHEQITENCSACHTQIRWLPALFDHMNYFAFDAEHQTDCRTCHINDNYTSYTCYGCHEHSASDMESEHVKHGIYDYENCSECHRSGDEDEVKRYWKSGKRDSSMERATLENYNQDKKYKKHGEKKRKYKKHRDDNHHEDDKEDDDWD